MATKLSEFINSDTPVLVDFYTEWWGPCRAMSPILQELKSRVGKQAKIIMLDLERSPKVAYTFDIRELPTLILFRKGKIIWRQGGVFTADQLLQVINEDITRQVNK